MEEKENEWDENLNLICVGYNISSQSNRIHTFRIHIWTQGKYAFDNIRNF